MKKLLFASDYDGTLFQNETISQSDLLMIKKWQNLGHLFGVVSGRNADSLYQENKKHNLNLDFFISNNGAMIEEKPYQPLTKSQLSSQIVKPLMELLIKYNQKHDCLYTIGINDGYNFGRYFFDENTPFNPDNKTDYKQFVNNPCGIFLEIKNTKYNNLIIRLLQKHFPTLAIYDHLDFIDIYSQPVSKALAISEYANHKNIPNDNCFVAGDHVNDISMLKHFNSFSITSGHKSIHQYANYKLDNIAQILKYILNNYDNK